MKIKKQFKKDDLRSVLAGIDKEEFVDITKEEAEATLREIYQLKNLRIVDFA